MPSQKERKDSFNRDHLDILIDLMVKVSSALHDSPSTVKELIEEESNLTETERRIFQVTLGLPQSGTQDHLEKIITADLIGKVYRTHEAGYTMELRNIPEDADALNVTISLLNMKAAYNNAGVQASQFWDRLDSLAQTGRAKPLQ